MARRCGSKNTARWGHFWGLRRRKSARRCGAKHFQVKMYKAHPEHTNVGPLLEVEMAKKARSTCPSQNVQSTPFSDHFWKLRCRESARRCGAKRVSKSNVSKIDGFGPLLEVQMSKKCMPLWREAHFQVKMYKAYHVQRCFGS